MRNIIKLMLLIVMVIGCGGSGGYFTYHREKMGKINIVEEIPIWIDTRFNEIEKRAIMEAIGEWNYVFNGQVVLKAEGYFRGTVGADERYEEIAKTGQGWIIMKLGEEDELVQVLKNRGALGGNELAFASREGGHLLVVLGERIGKRNLKAILLHEFGHLISASHINAPSLMAPDYKAMYNCIDKITAAQAASGKKLDMRTMGYCRTPNFE